MELIGCRKNYHNCCIFWSKVSTPGIFVYDANILGAFAVGSIWGPETRVINYELVN